MSIGIAILIVVLTALFIAADLWKSRKPSSSPTRIQKIHEEIRTRETERTVRLEREVDAKLREIGGTLPAPPAAAAPALEEPRTAEPASMNDTRCIHTVKQKADELERALRETSSPSE